MSPKRAWATLLAALLFVAAIGWAVGFEAGHGEVITQSAFPTVNGPTTVALLPTCDASLSGQYYLVTNALLPVLGNLLTGGGSVQVIVKCNGAGSWLAI